MYKGVPASQNSCCSVAIAVRARPNTFFMAQQLIGRSRTRFARMYKGFGRARTHFASRISSSGTPERCFHFRWCFWASFSPTPHPFHALHGGITHSIYAFTFLFSILFRAFLHRVAGTTPQRHSRVGGRIVVGRRHRFRHIHAVHVAFALRSLVPKRQ